MRVLFHLLPALCLLLGQPLAASADSPAAGRQALEGKMEAFYKALVEAQAKAMVVELHPDRWLVFHMGLTVRQGQFGEGARLGSNIPGGKLQMGGPDACNRDKEHPTQIVVGSDADRVYTITFSDDCKPEMGYDDY